MRRILILASTALFLPAIALGQHRGGGMVMHQPVIATPPRAAAPVQAAPAQVIASAPRMGTPIVARRARIITTPIQRAGTFVTLPTFPIDFANSPGLGFDFAHLAAINSGRMRGRFRGGFFSSGFSGFLLSPSVIVEEAPPEQPVVEELVAANPNPNEVLRERARRAEREEPAEVSSEPPAPLPDLPEFVFVRRDGGLLFAVAYSWDNGTLRYITRDGLRRSVTQESLDIEATQQFNEQRGVNFRLPA